MSSTHNQNSFYAQPTQRTLRTALGLLLAAAPFAAAQTPLSSTPAADVIAANVRFYLPDSPGTLFTRASSSGDTNSLDTNSADPDGAAAADDASDPATKAPPQTASHYQKYISPGEIAPKETVGDKVLLGMTTAISPFSMLGWLVSAGYSQVADTSPNYTGSTGHAFGQRLGAAAALNSSREIFGDSILCPVFHQDPRYYIMGKEQGWFKRLVYSGTRPLIGRTDGGRTIPNFANIGGTYAAAALSQAYYPPVNRGATQVAETFGLSLGGSALGYVVSEFGGDVISFLHLKKK